MDLRFKVVNKKSKIDGTGTFALETIPIRKKIGNLAGVIISLREARRRAKLSQKVAIVEFGDGRALDASNFSNELRFVNHSCNPNTFMRVCYSQVEFFAKKTIFKGEELTCDYGPTHHDGKLKCACGALNCRGFI